MAKILGLDLGTNSVGWAFVEFDEDKFSGSLIDWGARVIPSGGDQLSYFKQGKSLNPEKGGSVSKCAERRGKRNSRRNIFRYKMRRDKLLLVLDILDWKPEAINYEIDRKGTYPKVVVLPKPKSANKDKKEKGYNFEETEIYKVYERRSRAANGRLTTNEFAAVLYQLNQRRGYQDIGLLGQEKEEQGKSKIERELKPNQQKAILTINNAEIIEWTKPKKSGQKGKPIYKVEAGFEGGELFSGTTKLGYFDKRIGKTAEFIIEQDKEKNWEIKTALIKTGWNKSREQNNQSLHGKTIGESLFEYLVNELQDAGKKHWEGTLRRRIYDRIYYKKEFDKIWDKQSDLIKYSDEKLKGIAKLLAPNNEQKQQDLISKGLKWIIKEYIIFYQRPLRGGQRDDASDCPFEKKIETIDNKTNKQLLIAKKSAPVSHFAFQEFRIWQKINDLRVYNKEKEAVFLNETKYENLLELFNEKEEITQDDILGKLFGRTKKEYHTNFPLEISFKGNITYIKIKKALSKEAKENKEDVLSSPYKLLQLWQIIQTVKIKEARRKAFTIGKYIAKDEEGKDILFSFDFNADTINQLLTLQFEKGYGSLSVKAINRILPLMKRGKQFVASAIDTATGQRIQEFLLDNEIEKIGDKLKAKISDFKTFQDFSGLRYDEAAELVYGQHTRENQVAEYENWDDIELLRPTSLRHPIVEAIINECLKVTRDLWEKEKTKPDIIKIELAREFKNNEKRRKEIFERQTSEKKRNEEASKVLKGDQFKIENPTLSQIERWKLWEDQKYHCVYTNEYISPDDLFYSFGKGSDNKKKYKCQVDHIIPKARVYDDSYMNKVLVLADANAEKDKYTAREFMEYGKSKSGKPYLKRITWDAFVDTANKLPSPKRDRLLKKTEDISDDFIERQKRETQYISRRIIIELAKIVGSDKIMTTTGGVTNLLRQEWGLTDIFKRKLIGRYQAFEDKLKALGIEKKFIDKDEDNRPRINDFSKRIDHRHHAIDALTVACTTRKHIKYLNDKNQLWQKNSDDENRKERYEKYKAENLSFVEFMDTMFTKDERGKNKFRKPWDGFCAEIIDKLDEVLISYKQNKFYHSGKVNKFKVGYESGKPKYREQKTFAIKGSMHNEQPEGLRFIFTGEYMKPDKLLKQLEKVNSKRFIRYFYSNFPKSIAHKLRDVSNANNFDLGKIEAALDREPLRDRNGNHIDAYPLIEVRIASRASLIGLTERDWRTIPDKNLKTELEEHSKNYEKWDKAFEEDSVGIFNEGRMNEGKMRIDKITVLQKDPFSFETDSVNEIVERKNSFNKKSVFKKVGSSFTVLFESSDNVQPRKFKQVKLLDYARCVKEDGTVDFVEKVEGYSRYVLLDTHSYFYMPDENEDGIITIKANNKKEIFKKLYRLTTFSNEVYFLPHTTTQPMTYQNNGKEVNELGGSRNESAYALNSRRHIKTFGIPVVVDRLGNVTLNAWKPTNQ